jgi:hypothetical protein
LLATFHFALATRHGGRPRAFRTVDHCPLKTDDAFFQTA